MARQKRKLDPELVPGPKRRVPPKPKDLPSEVLTMWSEEVEGLLSSSFSSLEQVIDEIANRVCRRMNQPLESELHDFMVMMLESDSEICDELRDLFSLKA